MLKFLHTSGYVHIDKEKVFCKVMLIGNTLEVSLFPKDADLLRLYLIEHVSNQSNTWCHFQCSYPYHQLYDIETIILHYLDCHFNEYQFKLDFITDMMIEDNYEEYANASNDPK